MQDFAGFFWKGIEHPATMKSIQVPVTEKNVMFLKGLGEIGERNASLAHTGSWHN